MTKTGVKIKDVVIGDDFRVQRTYTGLPTGITVSIAWLTAKKSEKGAVLFQKKITGSLNADGHVTDNDTTGGSIAMFFDLTPVDTSKAKPGIEYLYDIQIRTGDGKIHTQEMGTISFIRGRTDETS